MLKNIATRLRDLFEGIDFLVHGGWRNNDTVYRSSRLLYGLQAFRKAFWIQYQLEGYRCFRRAVFQMDWAQREHIAQTSPRVLSDNARIVVLCFGHLGDLLHLSPTMREIRRQRPGWKLELVTGSWNRTFAPRLDVFDAIHYLSPDLTQLHRGRRADVLPLKYERRFIQQLRHNGMDVLFCPSVPQLAELPLIYALNPGIYIGYEWELEHVEYSGIKHTQPFNSRHYEMDAIADFLPEFGLERNGVQLRYRPAQEGKLRVSAWLREQEVTDGYVVVFPGSGWPGKCWPTDRFATIVSHIANRGLKVILAGSAEEKVLCDEIRRLSGGKALVAAGVFSIDESAALIELSVLLLGNDSVPVHLAAAMGVPSVSLWGPTFVEKWGPRGEKHRCIKSVVLCHCIYWHPNATCERAGECMKAIQTREVIRALDEMLESRPDTSPACL